LVLTEAQFPRYILALPRTLIDSVDALLDFMQQSSIQEESEPANVHPDYRGFEKFVYTSKDLRQSSFFIRLNSTPIQKDLWRLVIPSTRPAKKRNPANNLRLLASSVYCSKNEPYNLSRPPTSSIASY
jgi:hypothetical protein